jgi:hypothetical protein
MTVEEVARRVLVSPSKISRMETGHRGASPRDVRDLCDLYQVRDPAVREHLATLAREGRSSAWWQPYGLPYATYVGLEAAAVGISDFEPGVFPGLLQTPDYARAVHQGAFPRLEPEIIDERIEVRQNRQRILAREDPPPPQLRAIIDEAVMHRPIGGAAVMAAQLGHIIAACEQPHVSVRVLPYKAGAHPALDSTFIMLELADPVPSVVYVEGLAGQMYLERPGDVERYTRVFDRLASLSLSDHESLEQLARARSTFGQGRTNT